MNNKTKQFSWKNRDSAAYDLLQMVYHSPPYISSLSARLLSAIRSVESLPQLRDIVLDDKTDAWIRIYALRACSKIPVDVLTEEFKQLTQQAISNKESVFLSSQKGYGRLEPDLLSELANFAANHPKNRDWFFELLDKAQPAIMMRFIAYELLRRHSDDFNQLLETHLLKLLEEDITFLDISLVSRILDLELDGSQELLDREFDKVLELCLKNPEDGSVIRIARRWKRLRIALQDELDDWHVHLPLKRYHRNLVHDYQFSPAYIYLLNLYEKAKDSDATAYQKLVSIAHRWRGNVPMRAVATHWIGKLAGVYDVFPILSSQMKYGNVNWDVDLFDSPIRFEAGEALLQFKTPKTWELLVDSCFISPRDDLLPFQIEWIAYLTDYLSGEAYEYDGIHFGSEDNRGWFRQLADVSPDEVK